MYYNSVPRYEDSTGIVKYNMTNNYMFRYVLQKNEIALKGLIASLLHIDVNSITSAEILNPIVLGDNLSDKECVLDILVKLNNESVINLEMQVNNYLNWVPRSLYYLCREFTSLDHGEDYSKVKPAIHIGFLDFTLFDEHPEFYATYRMCNLKDGYIYTDKFTLSVVELKHTNLASDEDKAYGIDVWAKLFKATTWEDIKMLVQENTYLNSAAHTMFEGNIDDRILALCRKSDQEIQWDINKSKRLVELEKQVKNQKLQLTEKDSIITAQSSQLSEKDSQLAAQAAELEELRAKLAKLQK